MTIETESTPITAGIGEMLWDQLPSGKHFGGAPANFACYCSQLGAHAVLVSLGIRRGKNCSNVELTQAI